MQGFLGYNAAAPLPTLIQILDGQHPANNVPITVQRVPGSSYSYSGGGFVIVQQLIEAAEYEMLPSSTGDRRKRDRSGKIDGRTQEIQRLIGRSLRAVVDMKRLGPRTIWLDCDVLQADGGTRTASITGAYIALMDAVRSLRAGKLIKADPVTDSVSAVSVGLVGGRVLLDLCYQEDRRAEVDFNVVQTGNGRFVEVQGAAEAGTFSLAQMNKIIAVAGKGIRKLRKIQEQALRQRATRGRRAR